MATMSFKEFSKGKKVTTTYGSKKSQERRKKSSDSSSSSSTKSYVDKSGVIRNEGGTGFNINDFNRAVSSGFKGKSGVASVKFVSKNKAPSKTYFGSVGGKFYSGLSKQELLNNELDVGSRAKVNFGRTNLMSGKGTSADIFKALGTKQIDLSNRDMLIASRKLAELNNFKKALAEEKKIKEERIKSADFLTYGKLAQILGKAPKSKAKVKIFTNLEGKVIGIQDPFTKTSYRLSTPKNKSQLLKEFEALQLEKEFNNKGRALITKLEEVRKKGFKAEREKAIKEQPRLDKLEARFDAINKRLKKSADARKTFKSYSGKVVDALMFIGKLNPLTKLVPKKAEAYSRSFFKELSAIPYDFTIGAGRGLAGLVDQVVFQIQAVGIKGYAKEVSNQLFKGGAVKSVASSFDPRKPEGLANIVITLAIAKSIQSQRVKIREVKSLSKQKNWKVGEILKDNKGNYAIKTKGGKIFKVKTNEINALLKANKKGFSIRSEKTQVARIVKKQLKGKITRAEGKVLTKAQQKKVDLSITKEANKIARKTSLNLAERKEFVNLYSKFRKKPSLASARKLRKFESKVSIDQIVRNIDSKIASRLKIRPKAPKVKKVKTKKPLTIKQKVSKFKGKIEKKFKVEKSKADVSARKNGFKDAKEQVTYERAFTDYKTGNLNAGKTLSKIEKVMRSRKTARSKLASKRYETLRKDVLIEAKQFLKEGRIKIKNKQYARVKAPRKTMSKARAEAMAIQITQRYKRIENSRINKQAKEVLKEIIKGETIEIQNPQLLSAIKRLLNKQKLSTISKERRLLMQKGLVKGKTPKSSLGKATIKKLKAKSKIKTKIDRLARKRESKKFFGDAKTRKVQRKQIVAELEKLKPKTLKDSTTSYRVATKDIARGFVEFRGSKIRQLKFQNSNWKVYKKNTAGRYVLSGKETGELSKLIANKIQGLSTSKPILGIPKSIKRLYKRQTPTGSFARKVQRKQIVAREKKIIEGLSKGDPKFTERYSIYIDEKGVVSFIPKSIIPKKSRPIYASKIIKKSKLPKNIVETKVDGTIQILKTKKLTKSKINPLEQIGVKKAELERLWRQINKKRKIKTKYQQTTLKTIKKVKPVKRTIKRTPKLKVKTKLKVLQGRNTMTAIALVGGLITKTKKKVLLAKAVLTAKLKMPSPTLKLKTRAVLKATLKDVLVLTDVISDIDTIIKTDVTTKQKQILKQEQKILTEQITKLKTITKKIKTKLPKPVEFPKIKIPNWNTKLPKGQVLLVVGRYKKGNRVITLRQKLTPNRATRKMNKLVDNNIVASYDLKIVGVTKGKDIKRQSLRKFTIRKGRDPKVRINVEKVKYRLDRPNEKKQIRKSKRK